MWTINEKSELARFSARLAFTLDPFQRRACTELEAGHGVLVCAPTGAGKTVVGEFAVHLALVQGGKCFYTTPIKALSNQKYADLVAQHGRASVGLLTGDQSINADAPVVVMTTEVLRNMLYAGSDKLRALSFVVMDEVHFLADRFRGAVWEEVILHLPDEVRLVSLSATVSNAEEFGAWMETVRGDTAVIVDENRPVPLWQHVMVGRRLFDLFDKSEAAPRVDEDLIRHIRHRNSVDRTEGYDRRDRRGPRRIGFRPLPRPEVLARLDEEGLLPAITFIFSRAGCDAALGQCLRSGLTLVDPESIPRIDAVIAKHTGELARGDLEVLGYWEWREGLHRGLAAHHAGMLPAFRHAVEELFTAGLIRAVFATETLALGINMPARTVVLERLVKFNGETHANLTPGEYTQLSGRAGRRGIDVEGHAVVLWHPDVDTSEVAGLASTRTYPLRSSFRPGYNMTINLVDQLGASESRKLLERSFAQFQADRSVVGLVRGAERNETTLAKLRDQLGGDGEYLEYAELRARIGERERVLERTRKQDRRGAAVTALGALKRGDVVSIPAGRRTGLAVVLIPDVDTADPRPLVLTQDKWAGRVSAADFPVPAEALGRMRLPRHVDHRTARVRRDLASALLSTGITAPRRGRRGRRDITSDAAEDRELASLRRALRDHPVHRRPDREQFSRLGERYHRLRRETAAMREQIAATTNSLARTFDRILGLLTERGYTADGEVTADGRRLARIYSESDLLVAECLRTGLWTALNPAELAAVASTMVYESRQEAGYLTATGPTAPIRQAVGETIQAWTDLRSDEARHKLPPTREPDTGFVDAVYRWANGGALIDALQAGSDQHSSLSAGDFVRWCRQVIDLLDQITNSADSPDLAKTAPRAVQAIRRGVVAVDAV